MGLTNNGEYAVLDVFFRGAERPSGFYVCLLASKPNKESTMADMVEILTPGEYGYERQQIHENEWSDPVIVLFDYEVHAPQKTFGPAVGAPWPKASHVGLVTTPTGTDGDLLAHLPLSGDKTVTIGQSLKYTLKVKAK